MINHYGKYVSEEIPTTGVRNNNNITWLWDEVDSGNSICLTCEDCQIENKNEIAEDENFCDCCEIMKDYLIGSWLKDAEGLYYPDESGNYAAIVRTDSNVTQVVFSKTIKKCALCSPCYPGQADLDSNGNFSAYDLPDDFYRE